MSFRISKLGWFCLLFAWPLAVAGQTEPEQPGSIPSDAKEYDEFRTKFGIPSVLEVPQWDENEYDPNLVEEGAEDGELTLPLPCGGAMVFRRVEVGGNEGWLGEQRLELGSSSEIDAPLDYRREAFISGTFSGEDQDPRANHYYYLGKYEVTELQYRAVNGDCPEKPKGRRPAVKISWYDAVDFTRRYTEWLYEHARERLPQEDGIPGYLRLPTEVEWEYAARGGNLVDEAAFQKSLFPMDGEVMDYAWIRESVSSSFKPRPVGSLKPNPIGLYDMLGNAAELVFDLFRLSTNGHLHGQAGGFLVKGGHFRSWRNTLRTSWRQEHPHFNPAAGKPNRLDTVGFRVAISAPVLISEQRMQAIGQEWESLPKEGVSAVGGGESCGGLMAEARSALSTMQADLERCLVNEADQPLSIFPEPPLPQTAPPGRLPAWFKLRDTVQYMDATMVRQYGLWFMQAKDPDKALLLFKTAARKGDGWSALAIGAMYDPNLFNAKDFRSEQTAFSKANADMAYCWYRVAENLGEKRAEIRLDKLKVSRKGGGVQLSKISAGCIKVLKQYGGE